MSLYEQQIASLRAYEVENESLRAQIAELKAENERLRMALADTEALEIGTAERCAKLTRQRDEAVQMLAVWYFPFYKR